MGIKQRRALAALAARQSAVTPSAVDSLVEDSPAEVTVYSSTEATERNTRTVGPPRWDEK
jgi:hypothetical protein